MRHLIVLPGNSPRNRDWGVACAEYFTPWFDSVWMAEYAHWGSDEKWINLAQEEERLRNHVINLPADTAVYIFAKSIGSILAVNAIAHRTVVPAGCAFFGMPLDYAVPEVWQDDPKPLAALTAPTVIFHNDADPTASYKITSDTLTMHVRHATFIATHDATHDYLDFVQYEPKIVQSLPL